MGLCGLCPAGDTSEPIAVDGARPWSAVHASRRGDGAPWSQCDSGSRECLVSEQRNGLHDSLGRRVFRCHPRASRVRALRAPSDSRSALRIRHLRTGPRRRVRHGPCRAMRARRSKHRDRKRLERIGMRGHRARMLGRRAGAHARHLHGSRRELSSRGARGSPFVPPHGVRDGRVRGVSTVRLVRAGNDIDARDPQQCSIHSSLRSQFLGI